MKATLLKLTAFLLILVGAFTSCKPPVEEIKYTVSHTSLNFDATGGEAEFTVSVESPATVENVKSLSAWCQVSESGASPVNVTVTVAPNTNEAHKTSVVINMKSGETKISATVEINQEGAEWVLIGGIKWATRNVDMPGTFAATPQDAGMFYQWNKKVGWSATDPMINSDGGTTWDSSPADGDTWEKANDPCPPAWRVPTRDELVHLRDANSQWATINGVNGHIFGSNNEGLFLSAAGYRSSFYGNIAETGRVGYYWSSSSSSFNTGAIHLYFYNSPYTGSARKARAVLVRCVAED